MRTSLIDPVGAAFGARPVVGDHDHDRVVQVAGVGEESEHPADLLVGVREEPGEALHEPGRDGPLRPGEGVPGRHPIRPRGQRRRRRDQAPGKLAGERLLAPGIPAQVEPPAVAFPPARRRLVRGVAGAGRQVEKERLAGVDRAQVRQELDRVVGQVLGEVVAILHGRGRPDRVVVVVQGRHELVGLAAVEAVPAVEAPGQRPGGARRGHVRLVLGGQVPLADGVARVAGRAQDLGQVAVFARRLAPVAGIADRQVGHPAHAAAMVVAAGQQAGPGRRAQRRRVEVREPDPAGRQAIDHRRLDVGAVAAQLRVADVVEHDEKHVGRPGRRGRLRRPPGFGVTPVPADPATEILCHVLRPLSSSLARPAAAHPAGHGASRNGPL